MQVAEQYINPHSAVLAKQRAGMRFRPAYFSPYTHVNERELYKCTKAAVMRGPAQAYNPDGPDFQRVPCVHGAPLDQDSMSMAFMACLRYGLERDTTKYPSFKGSRK